jgi:hypothetical protein
MQFMRNSQRGRWFQFRLRSLLLALTVVGVVGGRWIIHQRDLARKQKAAVAKLKEVGAEIYSRPSWVHSLLVPDAPGHVLGIGLRGRKQVTDTSLAPLADLSMLVWIDLQDTAISDAGLVHISGLKKLERLRLDETQISDVGLHQLANLPSLRMLNVSRTRVSDAGLDYLTTLPIGELYLMKSGVTDEGVQRFRHVRPDVNIGG